jgi:hypothetical protein
MITKTPTNRELIIEKQKRAAATLQAAHAKSAATKVPEKATSSPSLPAVKAKPATPARQDDRPYRTRYLDEVAPASIAGRMVKFSREGDFITADDGQPIGGDAEFFALCDETLVGWVRFNGVGEPPDREMGLLYDGYCMPTRDALGDLDPKQWEEGLDGNPQDPWQHHQYLPLQSTSTGELFTFVTASKTGRRAVGNLLRHFERMRRASPDEIPVIRLGKGGFAHKDERVGFVITPMFVVVGKSPRDGVVKPDTSTAGVLQDEILF